MVEHRERIGFPIPGAHPLPERTIFIVDDGEAMSTDGDVHRGRLPPKRGRVESSVTFR
jgi:hypothetical protein